MQSLLIKILGKKYCKYIIAALNWRNTVGDYVANYSKVVKVENQVLFVEVYNSVVMQELILIRDNLVEKINRHHSLGIREIVFFINQQYRHNTK